MSLIKIGEVFNFQGGTQPPKNEWKSEPMPGYVRMLQIRDFTQGKDKHIEFVKDDKKLNKCKADDILIGRYGASVGKILTGLEGAYNVAIIKTIPDESKIHKRYLYYFLLNPRFQNFIRNIGGRAAQQGFNKEDISDYKLFLPPLPDQLHIANLLSKAENLIAQRKESIHLLDEFLKSTFLEMFGDPVRNEKGWEKDKVISYTDCIVPGRDKPKSFTGNIPWFTTEDLNQKGYVTKSKKELGLSAEEIKEVRARVIPAGSVLMTCVGDLGVISVCKEDCIVNQQLHAFISKEEINNLFLMYSLSFQTNFMYKKATSTTVPYMNKTTCNSIPVIVPPIGLQTKFAQIVEKTEALKTQYQQSLQELENLYGSLSQKAFRGELSLKYDSLLSSVEHSRNMAAEPVVNYTK